MMVTLILYCYSTGAASARQMEEMITDNIACRVITGNQKPDHDTIANFRHMHLDELGLLFQQILALAQKAELFDLKTVAADGSKVKANASKRKAMSHERMCKRVEELPQAINELKLELSNLEGKDDLKSQRECERLQQEIKFQGRRLARIKNGKKALEKKIAAKANKEEKGKINKPKPGDQFNFTDPESNIMHRSGKTFEQCYNGQTVVDSRAQIIVAQDVVQDGNDKKQLVSMLMQVQNNVGRFPDRALADNGYFSEENLTSEELATIDLYIPPKRDNKKTAIVGRISANISAAERMRRKLSTKAGKEIYKLRKCIVEPVFGQIKSSVLKFTHFSFRGLRKVKAEWALVCAAHNLLKIFRSGYRFVPSTA